MNYWIEKGFGDIPDKIASRHEQITIAMARCNLAGKLESDIEEILDETFYLELMNKEYKNHLNYNLILSELKQHNPRIIIRLEKSLETNTFKYDIRFSHYIPSGYFNENLSKLRSNLSEDTKSRFEKAFIKLNNLLK